MGDCQWQADRGNVRSNVEPERMVPSSPVDDPRHGDSDYWSENHCENSKCSFPRGHDGPCSDQQVQHRFRPRPRRHYAECTRCDECVFSEDHCGACEDSEARQIFLPHALAEAIVDSDSVLNFDPMESSINVVIDDVSNEILSINPSDHGDVPVPKNYDDTQKSPLKSKWDESMLSEYKALFTRLKIEQQRSHAPAMRIIPFTVSEFAALATKHMVQG